jgi:hypothetical protein
MSETFGELVYELVKVVAEGELLEVGGKMVYRTVELATKG